jgi:hypothetical protein
VLPEELSPSLSEAAWVLVSVPVPALAQVLAVLVPALAQVLAVLVPALARVLARVHLSSSRARCR